MGHSQVTFGWNVWSIPVWQTVIISITKWAPSNNRQSDRQADKQTEGGTNAYRWRLSFDRSVHASFKICVCFSKFDWSSKSAIFIPFWTVDKALNNIIQTSAWCRCRFPYLWYLVIVFEISASSRISDKKASVISLWTSNAWIFFVETVRNFFHYHFV